MYEEGRFEELYARAVLDDGEVEDGIRDGRLVRRRALRAPAGHSAPTRSTAAPAGSLRVEPAPDELQREQAELEFDAMQLLARTERWLMVKRDRNRERMARLIEQRDEAQSKAKRARRRGRSRFRPWRRLKNAFGP